MLALRFPHFPSGSCDRPKLWSDHSRSRSSPDGFRPGRSHRSPGTIAGQGPRERDPPRYLRRVVDRGSRRAGRALDRDAPSRGAGARQTRLLPVDGVPAGPQPDQRAVVVRGRISSTKCAKRCSLGHDLEDIAAEEEDPGLGNGGLGRLAACFLDSLATLGYAATGYGIRYDYGIFTQVIEEDGAQREVASSWLGFQNFWESGHGGVRYRVRFGGHCRRHARRAGPRCVTSGSIRSDVWAVGLRLADSRATAVPTVNHLRLWSGRAITPFRIEAFNAGNYAAAVAEQIDAKNLSRVLYPDDSTPQGKELRFKQQYFCVSASLQDMLAQHLAEGRDAARTCRTRSPSSSTTRIRR